MKHDSTFMEDLNTRIYVGDDNRIVGSGNNLTRKHKKEIREGIRLSYQDFLKKTKIWQVA